MWWYVAYLAAKTVLGTNAETKTALAQNKTAMSRLGKEVNQINLERAASRQRTSQALFNTEVQKQNNLSQVQLQAAGSGTVGASVQDAVSTVNLAADRQDAGIRSQQYQQEEGFRLQVQKSIDNTSASMDWESGADKLWNNILQNAGGALGQAAAAAATSGGSSEGESGGSGQTGASYNNYGYDLWGSKGGGSSTSQTGMQSWKSYLGN